MPAIRSHRRHRAGFTLIELLVVLFIIAILMALVTAATFRYVVAQQARNTNDTLRKVQSALTQHVAAVRDMARKDPYPASVLALAGNDATRAQVIWFKFYLKREFPMTYAEAVNPNVGLSTTYITRNPVYARAIGNRTNPPSTGETGACLYLALSQTRGNAQSIIEQLNPNETGDTDNDGLKEIIDGWGNPLTLFRWPIGNLELRQLAQSKIQGNTQATDPSDPQDSGRTLLANSWTVPADFVALCYPFTTQGNTRLATNYWGPVVASAGPNKKLGLLATMGPDLTNDPTGNLANDNIYSYLLLLGN